MSDFNILLVIRDIQNNIKCVVSRFQVNFSSLYKNQDAFDLCVFYTIQISRQVQLLSDSARSGINKVFDLSMLNYFSDILVNEYDNVDKVRLQSYIKLLVSDAVVTVVNELLEYYSVECGLESQDCF